MNIVHTAGIVPIFLKETPLYLIVQGKENGFWSFPKGRTEEGETIEAGAQRELIEETGIRDIDIKFDDPHQVTFSFSKDGIEYLKYLTFFPGYVKNKDITPQVTEIAAHKWATIEQCMEMLSFDDLKEIITKIHKKLTQ